MSKLPEDVSKKKGGLKLRGYFGGKGKIRERNPLLNQEKNEENTKPLHREVMVFAFE